MELSDKENKEEKRNKNTNYNIDDDSKVNKIKIEIKNIDGFLAGSGNCRSQLLPKLYWKKTVENLWNERS